MLDQYLKLSGYKITASLRIYTRLSAAAKVTYMVKITVPNVLYYRMMEIV